MRVKSIKFTVPVITWSMYTGGGNTKNLEQHLRILPTSIM